MHKVDISSYSIKVKNPATGGFAKVDYNVQEMLVGVLLHPSLSLTGLELYNRTPIADKIKAADGVLLLEEDEYVKLKSAVSLIKGFGMNDTELVRRVIEAEEVDIAESDG